MLVATARLPTGFRIRNVGGEAPWWGLFFILQIHSKIESMPEPKLNTLGGKKRDIPLNDMTRFSLKEPPVCPTCFGKSAIRFGKRKNTLGTIQYYQCKKCGVKYSETPAKYLHYPPVAVASALIAFNTGHTLEETATLVAKRHRMKVPVTTIHTWVKRYAPVCTFAQLRNRYIIKPDDIIKSRKLEHGQVYNFRYHLLKTGLAAKKFPTMKIYLKWILANCPTDIFKIGNRCSNARIPHVSAVLNEKPGLLCEVVDNNAVKMAKMALSLARRNADRHEAVQNFFITCDSATVATEVPVWLNPNEILKLGLPRSDIITGHIDIVQTRWNRIHVLDYKPELRTDTATVSQLYLYALALSTRTNIDLDNIRCAFFNDKRYVEFKPTAFLNKPKP